MFGGVGIIGAVSCLYCYHRGYNRGWAAGIIATTGAELGGGSVGFTDISHVSEANPLPPFYREFDQMQEDLRRLERGP